MDDDDGFTRSLFPELPPPAPRWEVTFTRAAQAGETLVPCAPMVAGVCALYTAEKAQAVAEVRAAGPGTAIAAARELCAGMPWVEGAVADVQPAGEGDPAAAGTVRRVRRMTQAASRALP
jgi:hypothetical protein